MVCCGNFRVEHIHNGLFLYIALYRNIRVNFRVELSKVLVTYCTVQNFRVQLSKMSKTHRCPSHH